MKYGWSIIIAPVNRLIPQCAIILLPWLFLITYGTTFRPNCLSERSPVLSRPTRYISLYKVCSPLQTVPKRGSSKCRVILDLSCPPTFSVNSGIPSNNRTSTVSANSFWLKDGVVVFTKKTFNALIASFRSTLKDYYLLGFTFNNHIYFDTRCPFGSTDIGHDLSTNN